MTPGLANPDAPAVLWSPTEDSIVNSAMESFRAWINDEFSCALEGYEALRQWSIDNPEPFWRSIWVFFDVQGDGSLERVLPMWETNSAVPMSGLGWFPDARLNYAQRIFSQRDDSRPALLICTESSEPVPMTWAELYATVAALAHQLREWGVKPGDRVAGYLPNSAAAVVGLLATASVGAVWTCCAPDYGVAAVTDRLQQIEPVVLIVADGYRYGGRVIDRRAEVADIVSQLTTVTQIVYVDYVTPGPPPTLAAPVLHMTDLPEATAELTFERVAFDHPLWILYSSGTTGQPKGIVHGHGGVTLEHLKWLGLHNDVRAGDRFFWFTSTAWMVWNVVVSSMMLGATAIVYDGSPTYPAPDALWSLVARTEATYFGTSAGYITASGKSGVEPREHELDDLRCIMSTGSPLPLDGWYWIYEHVGPDIWLDAPCGGTDVCTAYVGANPTKPVIAGEIQSRLLGIAVSAYDPEGLPLIGEVGDLVVTAPMPSMPLYFWGDEHADMYREAYFETFPGVWRHGDWITVSERGGVTVHGRSDSTINRHGVRMGSADIHAAVERMPEVREALVIGAEMPDGTYYMPLFVVLPDRLLDDDLRARISHQIQQECSRRHIPDEILQVPAIPHTLTGKRLEVPIKSLLQGKPREKAVNLGVVDDPSLLDFYVELGRARLQKNYVR
ncbi:MAG: acetoacetate--CoA ligase [Actinomycetes bacterium]